MTGDSWLGCFGEGEGWIPAAQPAALAGFWGGPAPGEGLARLGAQVLLWVSARQRRWAPGASRCEQTAVASGTPTANAHTRPVASRARSPPCRVPWGDAWVPRHGYRGGRRLVGSRRAAVQSEAPGRP